MLCAAGSLSSSKHFYTILQEYLRSSNLATFLGLTPVDALHMPLPLHIVFIGFQGDGNMRVKISAEELTEWFAHLDGLLPHTRVALSEISCSEDGEDHC